MLKSCLSLFYVVVKYIPAAYPQAEHIHGMVVFIPALRGLQKVLDYFFLLADLFFLLADL